MRIYFCAEGEKEECKVPSSAIGSPEGGDNSNNNTTNDNNNNNNNNVNNNSSSNNNTGTTKTNRKSGSDSNPQKPNNMYDSDKNNDVNSAGAGLGANEENVEAGKVKGGGVEMQGQPRKGGIGPNTEEEGMKREKENGEGEEKVAGGSGGGTEGMRGWPSGDAGQDVSGVGVDDVGGHSDVDDVGGHGCDVGDVGGRCDVGDVGGHGGDVGDQVGSDEAEDQDGVEEEGFEVTTTKSEDEQENENAEEKEEELYEDGSDSDERSQNENEVGKDNDIGEGEGDGDKELKGGLVGGDEDPDMDNVIVTEEEIGVSQNSKEGGAKKGVKEDVFDGKRGKNAQGKDDAIISKDKAITISTTSIVEKTDEGAEGESEGEIHGIEVDPHKEVWPKKKNHEEEEKEEVEEGVDIKPDEEGTGSGPKHSLDEEDIEKEEEEEEEEMVEDPEEGGRIVGGVFIEQTITVQVNGDVVDEVLEGHGVGQGQHVDDGKVGEGESVKDVQRSEEEEEVAKRNISSGNSIGGRRADGVWQQNPAQDDQEEEEEEAMLLDKISFVLFSPSSSPITIAVLSTLLVSSIIGLACIYCRGRRR